jgi:hypothetical protein
MTKQPSLKQISSQLKIDTVVARTGCTDEEARKELIAEEWNVADAVLNLTAYMAEQRKKNFEARMSQPIW